MAKEGIKQILAASDLSGLSDRALLRAFALAKELHAGLRVVHVVDANLPEELRSHSLEWAKKALARECGVAVRGVAADIEVVAGRPKIDIGVQAAAMNADLIVLGTHRESDPRLPFSDTTAGCVLKHGQRPVLVVRDDATAAYARVVIGVDFSVYSRAAIRQAFRVAPSARFHLVHAVHVPYKGFLGHPSFAEQVAYERRLQLDEFLKQEMELLRGRAREIGIRPEALEIILREGGPRQVLYAECSRVSADLIVIGTHGRTGVSRAVFGSVAADILNAPPCDVLVTPAY
jgi:nucleotide-binding universal stress UspA family protein